MYLLVSPKLQPCYPGLEIFWIGSFFNTAVDDCLGASHTELIPPSATQLQFENHGLFYPFNTRVGLQKLYFDRRGGDYVADVLSQRALTQIRNTIYRKEMQVNHYRLKVGSLFSD